MNNGSSPKLLFFVTEDWYFCSHRLPLAVAAKREGFDVAVVTRVRRHRAEIEAAGLRLIPLDLQRRGAHPWHELKTVRQLVRIYRAERPDIVHHVALKPVLYGSLAASLTKVPARVNALAGLGFVFASNRPKARLLRPFVQLGFRGLLNQANSRVILQNPDDLHCLTRSGALDASRAVIIRGSGVDTNRFSPSPEPEGLPLVILASRMLWDKGVGEFVRAAEILRGEGISARFALIGESDHENPAAIPDQQLAAWRASNTVEWWGRRNDMPEVLSQAHIVCLPSSYGEGLPKVLIEAAACGRPIVTTDAPGCREVVRHGHNGLLVPLRDAEALAAALRLLIEDANLRRRMGERGRRLVEREFSLERIASETLALYRGLLA